VTGVTRDGRFVPEVVEGSGGAPSIETAPFERGDHSELARRLVRRLRDGTESLLHADGGFYRYDSARGVYDRVDDEDAREIVASFAGSPMRDSKRNLSVDESDVRGALRLAVTFVVAEGRRQKSPRSFDGYRAGVACRNGFVVVEGGKVSVLPHSPLHLARHALPYDYDPSTSRPMLDQFFADVFADATDGDEVNRTALLSEFLGACLVGDATKYQRCLVLWGREGGNGKSQFLDVCRSLFPEDAVASLAPQNWGEKFSRHMLVGKMANFVDEVPARDISSSDTFKAVVDGQSIKSERKNRDPYSAKMTAGHIFNMNKLPASSDVTPAFFRRFLVCPFECDMLNSEKHVPDIGKLIGEKEGPGILAWAVEGAARRQRRSGYTLSSRGRYIFRMWHAEQDVLMAFLVSIDAGTSWGARELHRVCVDAGLTTKNETSFGRALAELSDPTDPGRLFDRGRGEEGNWYRRTSTR
jgi:putative DNA primase/helicase